MENARVQEHAQRLARELHDSVTEALDSISHKTEWAERALEGGDRESADTAIEGIATTTQLALSNMRLLLFELRPPLLEREGLAAALQSRLRAVESQAGLNIDLDCTGEGRLAAEAEHELFRLPRRR